MNEKLSEDVETYIIQNYEKLIRKFIDMEKDKFKRYCEGSYETEIILGNLRTK